MLMDIIRRLKELLARSGLREEEINFFVNTVKKPNSTIYDLAKKSNIPKDRAYKICDALHERRLIKINRSNKLRRIEIAPMNAFIEGMKNRSRSLYRTADGLKQIGSYLPFLQGNEEEMEYADFGHEHAVENFVDMSCRGNDNILAYGDYDSILDGMGKDSDKYFLNNRLKRGKKCFPIIVNPREYTWHEIIRNDNYELRKTKILFDESLRNCFMLLLPGIDTIGYWIKGDNGQVKGGIIKNPALFELYERTYKHLNSISDSVSFRDLEKYRNS